MTAPKLLDFRINDGSRHFLDVPESVSWGEMRQATERLNGAKITGYVSDEVIEMWLDFNFRGQSFSINNPCGEFWFFVDDADCPNEILIEIAEHFAQVLN